MNSTQFKKILILVTILAVPGFLYYLLQEKGKNRYKPLAFYGPKVPANTFHSVKGKQIRDTIYHIVPDFKLVNQDSIAVNWNSYSGKVLVLGLFHSTERDFGVDYSTKAMEGFSKMYEKNRMLKFLSLSIDPTVDRPALLKSYAKNVGQSNLNWEFLTGDSVQINQLVRKGLFLDALKTETDGQTKFTYSNLFVLIDTHHRIRGYYEATNAEALSKLDDEIKVLIAEELRNIKDGR